MIAIDGTLIFFASDGAAVVIGSSAQFLCASAQEVAIIIFKSSTYTAKSGSDFVTGGHALTPGGVITIDGTPISYAADETDVGLGTSTEAVGVRSYIMGGFGNGFGTASSTASAGESNYTGRAFSSKARGR